MSSYYVTGIMSGTSLDGADLVLCRFDKDISWKYEIIKSKTFKYSTEWKNKLSGADKCSALELVELHRDYGLYTGSLVNLFLKNLKIRIDMIASHGHTIFHDPARQICLQLGDGAYIAASTGIMTISNFRSLDIALHGQGAPLVPAGDEILFPEYDYCLNLGGFANVSFNLEGQRRAFDICPVNIALNYYSEKTGQEFDRDGMTGKRGRLNKNIFPELNNISYYKQNFPKSLGKEWLLSEFIPVIDSQNITIEDKLRTIYEHIAFQISSALSITGKKKVLITGGGTYNKFLISLLKNYNKEHELIIPGKELIDFKEAVIFAFLGVLRLRNEINCLSSVTGASADNSGGTIYLV